MAKIESKLRRPYHKIYAPTPMARVLDLQSRHITGQPIEPGTVVLVTNHYGPFRRIRDEHGNEMSVGRGSLRPVKEGS